MMRPEVEAMLNKMDLVGQELAGNLSDEELEYVYDHLSLLTPAFFKGRIKRYINRKLPLLHCSAETTSQKTMKSVQHN